LSRDTFGFAGFGSGLGGRFIPKKTCGFAKGCFPVLSETGTLRSLLLKRRVVELFPGFALILQLASDGKAAARKAAGRRNLVLASTISDWRSLHHAERE
jgi:hypothetical protein